MAEQTSYEARVVSLTLVTPHLRRVTLGGAGEAGWTATGAPDESLLLVLPGAGSSSRWYTVRRYDPDADLLSIDMVVHPAGLSNRWAQSASVGDRVSVTSTSSWWTAPGDRAWQVLVGDMTALPAISRVLETHSAALATRVVLEVPEAADEQTLEAPAGTRVDWLHTPAGPPSQLPDVVRALELPEGPGFVYVAGEAQAARAVRRHLRHERRLPAERYSVSGYWRAGSEEWMRRYLEVEEQLGLAELYERFQAPGADKEALNDEMDRRLADAGL